MKIYIIKSRKKYYNKYNTCSFFFIYFIEEYYEIEKSKKKTRIFNILFVIVIISLLCSYLLISRLNTKGMPLLMSYAEAETKKITTLVINNAVTKQLANTLENDYLFNIEKDNNGEIKMITYNSVNVTRILNTITNLIQLNLKSIEEGNIDLIELPSTVLEEYDRELLKQGIIYEIPVGVITENSFLSNLGPKIPLKLHLIGDVISNIETKVTEYGINNALIEVGVYVEVTTKINLPFISKTVKVSNVIPVSIKVIQGKIPEMYLNGFSTTSNMETNSIK